MRINLIISWLLCCTLYFSKVSSLDTIAFKCPENWVISGSQCYYLSNVKESFKYAAFTCSILGGKLTKVQDEVENDVLFKLAQGKGWKKFWIKNAYVSRSSEAGNMENCESFGLWDNYQPAPVPANSSQCNVVNDQGRWETSVCEPSWPYICETDACIEGAYRCDNGKCISDNYLCDGEKDCDDASDEKNCDMLCRHEQTGDSGEITVTTSDSYMNNKNCLWTITGKPGLPLKLSIEDFNTEENQDIVEISTPKIGSYDAIKIATLSGQQANQVLYSYAHMAQVQFITDSTVVKSGFKIKWTTDVPELSSVVQTVDSTSSYQEVTSPNYPKSPVRFWREWLVSANEGELISVEVMEAFKVHLYIYDGEDYKTVIEAVSDSTTYTPTMYISTSNKVRIILFNTEQTDSRGKLKFKKGCSFSSSQSQGAIAPPGYTTSRYPESANCDWTVSNTNMNSNQVYTFKIEEFNLEDNVDAVKVYDSNAKTTMYHPAGGFTGQQNAQSITVGKQFYLTFTSNLIQSNGMFKITYSLGCPAIPEEANLQISSNDTTPDSLVSITCDQGYSFVQAEYNGMMELNFLCLNGGSWNQTRFPTCQKTYCGVPKPIPNGFVFNSTGGSTYQDKVQYECYSGFQINNANPYVTCQENSEFTTGIECQASVCGEPPEVMQATVNKTGTDFAAIASYTCNPGYTLLGSTKLVCLTTGNWSHEAPLCRKKSCFVPSFNNSSIKMRTDPLLFEAKITYKCDMGYQVKGTSLQEKEIECGPDQRLKESLECEDIDECAANTNNCAGTQTCDNIKGSFVCTCKDGYEPMGATSCQDIKECTMNNGGCDQACQELPGSYMCSCNAGFKLFTEDGINNKTKPAQESGLRPGDVLRFNHSCVRNVCSKPGPVENGLLLSTREDFSFEEKIKFRCNIGYVLKGSEELECTANSTWSDEIPTCERANCSEVVIKGSDEAKSRATILVGQGQVEYGGNVTIQCMLDDGNTTNKILYCAYDVQTQNYTLQGDDPSCPVIDCGPVLTIPGSNSPSLLNTLIGQQFEFSCSDNFERIGTTVENESNFTVICEANGRWRYGNITCTGSTCSDPGTPGNATQITEGYGFGQTVAYRCERAGYTPVPNMPLICSSNGTHTVWNGTVPKCIDTAAPTFTDCPTEPKKVKMLEKTDFFMPSAMDNSGYVRIDEPENRGMSGYLLENTSITYVAYDGENNTAMCTVQYTVYSASAAPSLECPNNKTLGVVSAENSVYTIGSPDVQSNGVITSTPPKISYGIPQLNTFQIVKVTATGDQGQTAQCTFQVRIVAEACLQTSLSVLSQATRSCDGSDGNVTCTTTCSAGAYFQSGVSTQSYSCTGKSMWTGDDRNEDCVVSQSSVFAFSVKLQYKFNVLYSQCKDTFANHFKTTFSNSNINDACRKSVAPTVYYQFAVENVVANKVSGSFDTVDITADLKVIDEDKDIAQLNLCAENDLKRSFAQLFDLDSSVCGASVVTEFTILDSGNTCESDGYRIQNISNGNVVCLPCGPGTFYNPDSKTCDMCVDGEYQDLTNQRVCKKCESNQNSSLPRSHISNCIDTCPSGFSTFQEEMVPVCIPCSADYYDSGDGICTACPSSGSTVGITGASIDFCKAPCGAGNYSSSGFEDCVPCPKNFYSFQGATSCMECSSDKITASVGSPAANSCITTTECISRCQNGACTIEHHQPVCDCNHGYEGEYCNITTNFCQSNPCWNGGECKSSSNGFTCDCPSEKQCEMIIEGAYALTNIDPIAPPVPVPGNAECQQKCLDDDNCKYSVKIVIGVNPHCVLYPDGNITDRRMSNMENSLSIKNCEVQPYFVGDQCETDNINNCQASSCTEFGFCQDGINTTQCICSSSSYVQPRCERKDDLCKDFCEHGTCETFGSVRAQCICLPDYTGERCKTEIKQCMYNPTGCLYNGTCTETAGTPTYSCQCKPGYLGDHCETVPSLCSSSSCSNGLCYEDHDRQSPVCVCEDKFQRGGNGQCEFKDSCQPSPCYNNGTSTCSSTEGVFNCACNNGWEGSICQHETNECESNPCQNKAICTDLPLSFNCSCPEGFTGNTCETNIDDRKCNTTNTMNAIDLINGYYCECKPGFMGKDCSEDIDECLSFPCQHGGICNNGDADFICMCPPGWDGKDCTTPVNFCNNTVCNKGTCISLIDTQFCKCNLGVTGRYCEQSPSLCAKVDPCHARGTCADIDGSAKCVCPSGYKGRSCELISDPLSCEDVTCTHGMCNYGVCVCSMGYTGGQCESKIDRCASLTCPTPSTCMDSGIRPPACVCPDFMAFTGTGCKDETANYDLLVDRRTDDDTELFVDPPVKFNSSNGVSVMFWIAVLSDVSDKPLFSLCYYRSNSDEVCPLHVRLNDILLKSGAHLLQHGSTNSPLPLSNKKWNQVVITWTTTGVVTPIVNGVTLKSANEQYVFDEYLRLELGRESLGAHFYVSRLRVWEGILTSDQIFATFLDLDDIPKNSLIYNWQSFISSRIVTRISPSAAKSAGNQLCENGVYHANCVGTQPDKTPPTIVNCGANETVSKMSARRSYVLTPDERGADFPKFSGGTTFFIKLESEVVTWGSYDLVFVNKDESDNYVQCYRRITIYESACQTDIIEETMATELCASPSYDDVCKNVGQQPSIPSPNIFTCGKLGSYNGLDWRTPLLAPPCGGVSSLQLTVTVVLPYIMALNCLNSHENLLKTQLEQKFAEIRLTWPKMCVDSTCTNAAITVSCRVRAKRAVNNNQHITGTVVVSSLPPRMNNTNQTLVLSPVEILTPILKESEQFSFPGIGKADLQQAEVTINGVGSCPAGKTVMNNKCVSCGPGSLYNATTEKCDVCPIGYHQDLAERTSCTACSNGQTTLRQGSRSVMACIEECPAGSFYHVENSTCAVCPRDYYQPEAGQSFCHACALTKRTRDNGTVEASSCVDDCPDGTEISATNADDCVQCKQNFYRASSINDRCIMCPGENVTLQNASISINQCIYPPCGSGTYIDVNTRTCQPCPYGEYQHQEWKTSCIPCPAKTSTRSPGANSSQLCEFVCPAGQERLNLTKEECTECKRGYTKSIEPTTQYGPCVKCSDSTKTTVGTGSTNEQNCSITICLAGTQRFEGNNTCGDCPVGSYQDEDLQDSCKQCPNKYTTQSPKSTNMSECIFYCEGGQEVKSAADETCQLCPRGKYSMAEFKLLNCQECKNGKTTNATGSLLSSDCNVDICNQGQIISSGCNDCGFDTFQPVTLPDLGTTCQPCPSGQGTNQTARTSLGDCMVFCNAGQQKNEMTGLCEDCPKGTWNDANTTTRFLSCMPCPTGYTTIQNGSESEQSCSLRNCPPGQIIVNTDQCEPCDFGTYQPLYHQTSCESCDSKENTSSTGAASKDRCQISCPAGEQGMDLTCSVCPDDTSKARSGYEPCIQCEGHFTSNAAKTTCDVPFCDTGAEPINDVCTNCTVGFYKAERGNTSCMPCPTNFTTAAYGSMASSDCDQPFCEKGFFWSSANKMCEKCQEKTYNDRLGQTECKPCPAARTTANVGAVSRTDCSLAYCDAGKFRSDVLVCSDCSHGYYQPSEGSTSCLTCPSGTNTTEAGSVNATQCLIICPAGQFRNSSNKCQPCEVGYYQPDSFTDSCMKCADNFTTTSTGSDSLQQCNIICEVGTYRKTSDRDVCTDCRVASYQNKTGQISCVSCPNGGTTKLPKAASSDLCLPVCGPGTYLDEVKKQCVDCDLGKFSSETGIQTSCTQCPNGKTTETEKSTSAAACTLDDCTKGQKREAGGCALCPIGYYQNETSQATCMKCPTGKTTLKTGATDIILCIKDCPDGQEYIFKTKTCKICQVGFYKNNNLKVCEKCPAGQTTASEGTPCVASHVTERPVAVRTYTMITVYTITTCDGNRNQIKGLLIRFILDALIREHAIYQGICRDTRCSNVITNILICDEIPGGSGRTRRATSGLAQATTQVQDIPELVSSTNATRTSESVLETALYDIVQDQAKLAENGVTYDGITSIDATTKCVTGQRMVNRTCVDCNAGQYYSSVSTLCVECEKGSYQPNARQSSCVKCPEIKTTAATGSKALTDCVSPCQFNSAFCQHGGTCKSSETKMYCECPENYKGLTCGEREGVSSSMAPILGGAIGGGVGLFVIVLIIVGCCVCYKNRVNKEKENKAMLPPYAPDDMDYFTPYGSKSSNGGFPTVLPLPAVRAPNPMYLDYQKDWDVFDRSGQYGQYGNDNRSALFERSPRSIENA